MKSMIVVALALVAVAAAIPVDEPSKIVSSSYDQQPNGGYKYAFESDDGINRLEEGKVKQALDEENKPHDVVVVRGSYTYIDPEGVQQTISYEADENGFRAQGPSIPVAPARR